MRNSILMSLFLALFAMLMTTACGGKQSSSQASNTAHGAATAAGSELILINNSAEPVFFIVMSQSSEPEFGPDLLGENVLPVGGSFRITGITAGLWDIRVMDSSGNKKDFYRQTFDGRTAYQLEIDSYGWTR